MYFIPNVKEFRNDLFNYNKEYDELKDHVFKETLILIKGPRRVGKSSLMRVVSNELTFTIYLDVRSCSNAKEFLTKFSIKLQHIIEDMDLSKKILKHIKGMDVLNLISLNFKDISNFSDIFETIEEYLNNKKEHLIIFIDEAQILKEYGIDITRLIAHIYDYTKHIHFVLAGSQIGLLEKMILNSKDMKGRIYHTIELKRLNKQKAMSFLLQGFEQVNKQISISELEDAIQHLDGLIGWLTYYGYYRLEYNHEDAIKIVEKLGYEIAEDELSSFLSTIRANRMLYILVLQAIGKGLDRWTDIKRYVDGSVKDINETTLNRILTKLIDYGFVEKRKGLYSISDPLIKLVVLKKHTKK